MSPISSAEFKAHRQACFLVGHFMYDWALLEAALNMAMIKLLRMKNLEGMIVANNMQCRSKIHIIKTLMNLVGSGTDWSAAAIKNIEAIATMSEKRNMVAHTAFDGHEEGGVEFFTIKAKGKVSFPDTIWRPELFGQYRVEMSAMGKRLDADIEVACKRRGIMESLFAATNATPAEQEPVNALLHLLRGNPDSPQSSPEEAPQTQPDPPV